jgi:hypothetical protein
MTNNYLIFKSPSSSQNLNRQHLKTNGPHKITHKNRPGPIITLNRPNIEPIQPTLTLARPEPGNQTPTQNKENTENMEVQVEKKRRREREHQSNNEIEESQLHFLTASPGRQDCRDQ